MSDAEKTATVTLDEVLETARAIVNHTSNRPAIGISVARVRAMAHTVCALHDIARSAAEMLVAAERSHRLSQADDVDAEVAAVEDTAHHENELTDGLMALGYLNLETQETNDERAD